MIPRKDPAFTPGTSGLTNYDSPRKTPSRFTSWVEREKYEGPPEKFARDDDFQKNQQTSRTDADVFLRFGGCRLIAINKYCEDKVEDLDMGNNNDLRSQGQSTLAMGELVSLINVPVTEPRPS